MPQSYWKMNKRNGRKPKQRTAKWLVAGAPAWRLQTAEGDLSAESQSKARHVHWNELSLLSSFQISPPVPFSKFLSFWWNYDASRIVRLSYRDFVGLSPTLWWSQVDGGFLPDLHGSTKAAFKSDMEVLSWADWTEEVVGAHLKSDLFGVNAVSPAQIRSGGRMACETPIILNG